MTNLWQTLFGNLNRLRTCFQALCPAASVGNILDISREGDWVKGDKKMPHFFPCRKYTPEIFIKNPLNVYKCTIHYVLSTRVVSEWERGPRNDSLFLWHFERESFLVSDEELERESFLFPLGMNVPFLFTFLFVLLNSNLKVLTFFQI